MTKQQFQVFARALGPVALFVVVVTAAVLHGPWIALACFAMFISGFAYRSLWRTT